MFPTVQKRGGDEALRKHAGGGSRFAVNSIAAGRPVAVYPPAGCSPVLRRGGDGTFKGRVVRFAFRGQFDRLRAICRGFTDCRMLPTVQKRGGDEAFKRACRVGSRFAVNLVTVGRPVAAYPPAGCFRPSRSAAGMRLLKRVVRFAFRGQFGHRWAICRGLSACRMFPTVRKRGGDEAFKESGAVRVSRSIWSPPGDLSRPIRLSDVPPS